NAVIEQGLSTDNRDPVADDARGRPAGPAGIRLDGSRLQLHGPVRGARHRRRPLRQAAETARAASRSDSLTAENTGAVRRFENRTAQSLPRLRLARQVKEKLRARADVNGTPFREL